MSYKVPILLLIFNRPSLTSQSFNIIKSQRPKYLYIAADGPRAFVKDDEQKCQEARDIILKNIDWNCEVKTLFRETNLGCGQSVSSAITWFFSHVEEGIILEDDCIPNKSFFSFCEELLCKYRHENTISAISGNNFQPNQLIHTEHDYHFSVFPSSWGWATWRRAWDGFDLSINSWNTTNQSELLKFIFKEQSFRLWWKNEFNRFYLEKRKNTWDFQFHYLSMVKKQLAIVPRTNLVSNIGHGPGATHFLSSESHMANLPTYELNFPLKHPESVIRNYKADLYHQKLVFGEVEVVTPYKAFKRFIKRMIRYHLL